MPTTPSGGGVSTDTLYFTTEFSGETELNTGRIYLGGTLVGKPSVWEELPELYKKVDLGLPSGRLWADRNVGAASPEAYGDYFMWGSTTPDTDNICDWAHAPFNNGSSKFDSGYFKTVSATVCPRGVLASEYDAAHMIMGGNWRMPTSAEMRELIDRTTQTEEGNGMRFTSKANGNSIFMPKAGWRSHSDVSSVGEVVRVWSSSLYISNANYSYYLTLGNGGVFNVGYDSHYIGYVVRGVC